MLDNELHLASVSSQCKMKLISRAEHDVDCRSSTSFLYVKGNATNFAKNFLIMCLRKEVVGKGKRKEYFNQPYSRNTSARQFLPVFPILSVSGRSFRNARHLAITGIADFDSRPNAELTSSNSNSNRGCQAARGHSIRAFRCVLQFQRCCGWKVTSPRYALGSD